MHMIGINSRFLFQATGDPGATAKWAPGRSAAVRGLKALAGPDGEPPGLWSSEFIGFSSDGIFMAFLLGIFVVILMIYGIFK